MTITEQTITLNGLRFYSYHGAEPQEAVVGAWYTVDLIMNVQVNKAIENDTLAHTVNYAKVTEIVKKEMAVRSKLLEHVAGRILSSLFENFSSIQSATVTVSKENPPVPATCRKASFTLTAKL